MPRRPSTATRDRPMRPSSVAMLEVTPANWPLTRCRSATPAVSGMKSVTMFGGVGLLTEAGNDRDRVGERHRQRRYRCLPCTAGALRRTPSVSPRMSVRACGLTRMTATSPLSSVATTRPRFFGRATAALLRTSPRQRATLIGDDESAVVGRKPVMRAVGVHTPTTAERQRSAGNLRIGSGRYITGISRERLHSRVAICEGSTWSRRQPSHRS